LAIFSGRGGGSNATDRLPFLGLALAFGSGKEAVISTFLSLFPEDDGMIGAKRGCEPIEVTYILLLQSKHYQIVSESPVSGEKT